jgi:5'-3' exonuclease
MENGIKPVWVFDGPPPKKKNGEILRRKKIK